MALRDHAGSLLGGKTSLRLEDLVRQFRESHRLEPTRPGFAENRKQLPGRHHAAVVPHEPTRRLSRFVAPRASRESSRYPQIRRLDHIRAHGHITLPQMTPLLAVIFGPTCRTEISVVT